MISITTNPGIESLYKIKRSLIKYNMIHIGTEVRLHVMLLMSHKLNNTIPRPIRNLNIL